MRLGRYLVSGWEEEIAMMGGLNVGVIASLDVEIQGSSFNNLFGDDECIPTIISIV